jgi:hypothetical protein
LTIFEESRGEASAHRVSRVNRAEPSCPAHVNGGTSTNRDGARAKVAQRFMKWREIAPRGGAEARPAGDRGAARKARPFERCGDAIAICGALAELRCRTGGDGDVESLTCQRNREECVEFGVKRARKRSGITKCSGGGVQTCNATACRPNTRQGEGEGGGQPSDWTWGNGIDGQECGDATCARGPALGDHRWEGADVEHDHRSGFITNGRGEGGLCRRCIRFGQARIAWHIEVRLGGAATRWLCISLARGPLQVGAERLGLTAQRAKCTEE